PGACGRPAPVRSCSGGCGSTTPGPAATATRSRRHPGTRAHGAGARRVDRWVSTATRPAGPRRRRPRGTATTRITAWRRRASTQATGGTSAVSTTAPATAAPTRPDAWASCSTRRGRRSSSSSVSRSSRRPGSGRSTAGSGWTWRWWRCRASRRRPTCWPPTRSTSTPRARSPGSPAPTATTATRPGTPDGGPPVPVAGHEPRPPVGQPRRRTRAGARQGPGRGRRHPDQPARHRAADDQAAAARGLGRQGRADGHLLVARRPVPDRGRQLPAARARRAPGAHRGPPGGAGPGRPRRGDRGGGGVSARGGRVSGPADDELARRLRAAAGRVPGPEVERIVAEARRAAAREAAGLLQQVMTRAILERAVEQLAPEPAPEGPPAAAGGAPLWYAYGVQ